MNNKTEWFIETIEQLMNKTMASNNSNIQKDNYLVEIVKWMDNFLLNKNYFRKDYIDKFDKEKIIVKEEQDLIQIDLK